VAARAISMTAPAIKRFAVRFAVRRCGSPGCPILFDGMDPQASEQYRIIRTKIHHHSAQPSLLTVSSAITRDGKTISAIKSCTLAVQEDLQVLLIDADFRRFTPAKSLGLNQSPGLSAVVQDTASIEEVEQRPARYGGVRRSAANAKLRISSNGLET
jgi:Mrp family chromosome partitioning ATPase